MKTSARACASTFPGHWPAHRSSYKGPGRTFEPRSRALPYSPQALDLDCLYHSSCPGRGVSWNPVGCTMSQNLNERVSRRVGIDVWHPAGDDGQPPAPVSEGNGLLEVTCPLMNITAFHTCRLRTYSASDKCGHWSRPSSRPSVSAI